MTTIARSARFKDAPAFEDLQRCVHCGYCICDCPTYLDLGRETESPRGRLHLISALAERRVRATPALLAHLDRCVQCRACETVCPSGVAFGRIMERGRALVLGGAGGTRAVGLASARVSREPAPAASGAAASSSLHCSASTSAPASRSSFEARVF